MLKSDKRINIIIYIFLGILAFFYDLSVSVDGIIIVQAFMGNFSNERFSSKSDTR